MVQPLTLSVPGSKSHTQRALVVGALAKAPTTLLDPLHCDDSVALRCGLRALGAQIDDNDPERWLVTPALLSAPVHPIDCGEAGTTIRFLAALSLLVDGKLQLTGSERLRHRPIDPLLDALRELGVTSSDPAPPAPLALRRFGDLQRNQVRVDSTTSSQFASGLLLVAPRLARGLSVELYSTDGKVVSRSYVAMTLDVMARQGIEVSQDGSRFAVPAGEYRGGELQIEADWSSAAFLLAAAFIAGRQLRLTNLPVASTQGDAVIGDLLDALRAPTTAGEHRFDLSDCPDLLPPLAAACVFGARPSLITGIAHTRAKECDRVAVLSAALQQLGVQVHQQRDAMHITPRNDLQPALLEPHSDHRMAMAFGLLSLRQPRIEVSDPFCVNKSFPTFFQALEKFRHG